MKRYIEADVNESQNPFEKVKVGDLFYTEFGVRRSYFAIFQVVSLAEEPYVRIHEVQPTIKKEDTSRSWCRYVSFEVSNKLLPPKSSSIFINDQQNGDLVKIIQDPNHTQGTPGFVVHNVDLATPYHGETLYEDLL